MCWNSEQTEDLSKTPCAVRSLESPQDQHWECPSINPCVLIGSGRSWMKGRRHARRTWSVYFVICEVRHAVWGNSHSPKTSLTIPNDVCETVVDSNMFVRCLFIEQLGFGRVRNCIMSTRPNNLNNITGLNRQYSLSWPTDQNTWISWVIQVIYQWSTFDFSFEQLKSYLLQRIPCSVKCIRCKN